MIIFVEIPYPEILSRTGLIGTARVPNISGLVLKEAIVTRDIITEFGSTVYDVRIGGASVFPNDAARPTLGVSEESDIKPVSDVAAPALAKVDFVVLSLGAGGGGYRPTLILKFDDQTETTAEAENVSVDETALVIIEGENVQEIVESIDLVLEEFEDEITVIEERLRAITPNSKSVNYTTVLADAGKSIVHPVGDDNARTFTIDSNANVPYPVGTVITFINRKNTVTIAITSDTLILAGTATTGSRTLAVNGIATAVKTDSTEWLISGTGLT